MRSLCSAAHAAAATGRRETWLRRPPDLSQARPAALECVLKIYLTSFAATTDTPGRLPHRARLAALSVPSLARCARYSACPCLVRRLVASAESIDMTVSHHSHSGEFCCHAKGTLSEVVDEAIRQGFSTFCLSEHVPRYQESHMYPEEVRCACAPTLSYVCVQPERPSSRPCSRT